MERNRNVRKRTCVVDDLQIISDDFTNLAGDPRLFKRYRSCEDSKPNLFKILSEEILFLILDHLDSNHYDKKNFSLVCRFFYAAESRHRRTLRPFRSNLIPAALSRYLYISQIDLSLCPLVSDGVLASIATTIGPSLLSIDLSRSMWVSSFGLRILAASCASLVEINLSSMINLNDASASAIGQARNLERLWLARCRNMTDIGIGCIAAGCQKLKLLCLKMCSGLTDLGVGLVAVKCMEVRILDLSHTMITEKSIAAIIQLPYLKKLSIASCSRIFDPSLTTSKQGCKSLEVLDMSNCQNLSDTSLSFIINGASNLSRLILINYFPNKIFGIQITHSLARSLHKLDKLEIINLDGCQISSHGLLALGSFCNSLKELSLRKCSGVTDDDLSFVVKRHGGLTKLDITCCREITNIAIASIARSCANLVSLRMESCGLVAKNAFPVFGIHCVLLEELDLTDTDLDNLGLKAISSCHKLLILKIGLCLNVNDEGIIEIGKGCPCLQEFDLYRTVGITDTGITTIGQGCPMLQIINLSYCTEITDNSLKSLSKCSKLTTLEIRGCSKVSSHGIATIALGCKEITKLDLKKCFKISDVGIIPFARLCHRLRHINLSYSSVTDVGLLALASNCCLQSITILHLSGLTANGLVAALMACGGLTRVKLHMSFKSLISQHLFGHLKACGFKFQWSNKPFQAEVIANVVWRQRSRELVGVV